MPAGDGEQRESARLDRATLSEVAARLAAVRRRCADDADLGDRRTAALTLLDAVLADLDAGMTSDGAPLSSDDVILGLATVESLFESAGSTGFVSVIASIRSSLNPRLETSDGDDPPPPQRFRPPPGSARPRRRPRPAPPSSAVSPPGSQTERAGLSGRLIVVLAVVVLAVGAATMLLRRDRASFNRPTAVPTVEAKPRRIVDSTKPEPAHERREPVVVGDEFDEHEEEMARFTLEIRLAEQGLADGDVNRALEHFALAASIDRHHHRVVATGKRLIAALLQEADRAWDAGDPDRAGKRVQGARSLARGLRLDESPVDNVERKLAVMTRFEDVDPRDREGLMRAIERPVRLTLKSRDVVFGHLTGIEDDVLLVEVYSGIEGGEAEFSTRILLSTVRSLRVYDAREPSEIITGD